MAATHFFVDETGPRRRFCAPSRRGAMGFEQPMASLTGALYINSLAAPGLIGALTVKDYFNRARSVTVGPEALLIAYSQPGFRDELVRLEAGRRVGDLSQVGFPKRAASLKVICVKP